MSITYIYIFLLLLTVAALGVSVHYLRTRWHQAERGKKIQQILFTLSRALASNFSREAVLQGLAHSLSAVIKVSRIGVILFEDHRGVLYGVYDERKTTPSLPYVLELQRYPELREVLWSPHILYIREVAANPLFMGVKEQMDLTGITSLLVVPLNHQGRVLGALTLAQHQEVREFSPEEMELCEAVAASAAIALVNRELFEQLKKQTQELMVKNEELLESYRVTSFTSEELKKSYQKLQEAQEKLITQEKLKAVIELAYATAHEINQPLAALSLSLEMMRDNPALEGELKQKLEKALDQTYRIAEVVKKLGQLNSYHTVEYLHGQKMIDLEKSRREDKDK